jgi:DNA-binding CsgD family transcriptional regulator
MRMRDEVWRVISYPLPRPGALAVLTPSELDVVERWVEGASMRAIARERGSAVRTVANHLAGAYRKLGVSSRSELVALALTLTERG